MRCPRNCGRCSACRWKPPTVSDVPREVNTQNHQRVNAEAMKRAYSEEDVKVSPTKLEYLTELLAQGIISSDAAVERQIYMESLRARAIEEAGISAEHGSDPRCVAGAFGYTACPCSDCKARRQRTPLLKEPPIRYMTEGERFEYNRDQRPPPMERKPAPKCPPSCTPVEPCKRLNCVAVDYVADEAMKARFTAIGDENRRKAREAHAPKPPRREARRIGAADLSFGRWNGRVPR